MPAETSTVSWAWRDRSDLIEQIRVGRTKNRLRYVMTDGRVADADVDAILVTETLDDGWQVRVELGLDDVDGSVAVRQVTVARVDGTPGQLKSDVLRSLRLGRLLRQIEEDVPFVVMNMPSDWHRGFVAPRPGKRGHPPHYFAMWVSRYVDACAANPRAPMKALIEQYPEMNRKTINAILLRAERENLLTDRVPRKAGGTMTAKCRRILDGKRR